MDVDILVSRHLLATTRITELSIKHCKLSIDVREFQAEESKISLGNIKRSIVNRQSRDTGITGHKTYSEDKQIKTNTAD